jgi:hypothetical protein
MTASRIISEESAHPASRIPRSKVSMDAGSPNFDVDTRTRETMRSPFEELISIFNLVPLIALRIVG